jgi:hypothetical protein
MRHGCAGLYFGFPLTADFGSAATNVSSKKQMAGTWEGFQPRMMGSSWGGTYQKCVADISVIACQRLPA